MPGLPEHSLFPLMPLLGRSDEIPAVKVGAATVTEPPATCKEKMMLELSSECLSTLGKMKIMVVLLTGQMFGAVEVMFPVVVLVAG